MRFYFQKFLMILKWLQKKSKKIKKQEKNIPERPEPSGEDAPNGSEGDFDLPETMTVEGTDAEFEIERPKGDTEEVIVDTEQLNLF